MLCFTRWNLFGNIVDPDGINLEIFLLCQMELSFWQNILVVEKFLSHLICHSPYLGKKNSKWNQNPKEITWVVHFLPPWKKTVTAGLVRWEGQMIPHEITRCAQWRSSSMWKQSNVEVISCGIICLSPPKPAETDNVFSSKTWMNFWKLLPTDQCHLMETNHVIPKMELFSEIRHSWSINHNSSNGTWPRFARSANPTHKM